MKKNVVLSIAARQEHFRKDNNFVRRRFKYLNFGLLGLPSLIEKYTDYYVRMFQGDDLSIEDLIARIESTGIDIAKDCKCILLSIPSFYSTSWCIKFCEYIHNNYDIPVIVGGRWVVDNNTEWVKRKLEFVDIINEGFGEKFISEYFNFSNKKNLMEPRVVLEMLIIDF